MSLVYTLPVLLGSLGALFVGSMFEDSDPSMKADGSPIDESSSMLGDVGLGTEEGGIASALGLSGATISPQATNTSNPDIDTSVTPSLTSNPTVNPTMNSNPETSIGGINVNPQISLPQQQAAQSQSPFNIFFNSPAPAPALTQDSTSTTPTPAPTNYPPPAPAQPRLMLTDAPPPSQLSASDFPAVPTDTPVVSSTPPTSTAAATPPTSTAAATTTTGSAPFATCNDPNLTSTSSTSTTTPVTQTNIATVRSTPANAATAFATCPTPSSQSTPFVDSSPVTVGRIEVPPPRPLPSNSSEAFVECPPKVELSDVPRPPTIDTQIPAVIEDEVEAEEEEDQVADLPEIPPPAGNVSLPQSTGLRNVTVPAAIPEPEQVPMPTSTFNSLRTLPTVTMPERNNFEQELVSIPGPPSGDVSLPEMNTLPDSSFNSLRSLPGVERTGRVSFESEPVRISPPESSAVEVPDSSTTGNRRLLRPMDLNLDEQPPVEDSPKIDRRLLRPMDLNLDEQPPVEQVVPEDEGANQIINAVRNIQKVAPVEEPARKYSYRYMGNQRIAIPRS